MFKILITSFFLLATSIAYSQTSNTSKEIINQEK